MAASLAVAAAASPGRGYLPLAGPVALRFAPAPRIHTNRFVLAAPVPAPVPAPIAVQIEKAKAAPSLAQPAPEASAALQRADSLIAQPLLEPSSPDGGVSPQMFLKYFNKSTNSPASVVAPLEFTPPKSLGQAPSRAGYSTGP